ncbi:acetamidase/formamidase family protein [Arabiibacter massiliensis]|uniref:acetamidase/formamidase family protein n=1 Tax=Arabiibacter massiliensis TaxID=1870985 RepID=UPI0009BA90FC|nr:acetamidase/formamidase family protein [Arabiibacter massiliensis]
MKVIDSQVYAFSKDNAPCYTAQPGEVLKFKTLDCFSNRLVDETVTMASLDYGYDVANPAAGPVYVEGAEPGDVLVVDIYDIEVADEGTIATDDHCGPLFEGTDYRTKKVPIVDGMAEVNGVKFPIDPMIGVIGTAPDGDDVIDGYVGAHGGNLDNKLITKGTRLYFPVRVPGALLQMGDVHAAMGDAELCGTGIEIASEITVKVSLIKGFELNWPVHETFGPHGQWYVNASAQEFNEALVNASKEMQRLLMRVTGWDAVDTYMYMSVRSDVELNQACKPCEVQLSLRMGTPKLPQFPPLVG